MPAPVSACRTLGAVVLTALVGCREPSGRAPAGEVPARPPTIASPSASPRTAAPAAQAGRVASPAPVAACPAGTTRIPGGSLDDAPGRTQAIASFCIGTTEVTVAAYRKCRDDGACTEPSRDDYGRCNELRADRDGHPVNCVTWAQAGAFCAWTSQRLPTAAEWAWSARNGDAGDPYPWGKEPPSARRLNACDPDCIAYNKKKGTVPLGPIFGESDGFAGTAPVGSFPEGANRWGVLDLQGNVSEWTADEHAADPAHPGWQLEALRAIRGASFFTGRLDMVGLSSLMTRGDEALALYGIRCAKSL